MDNRDTPRVFSIMPVHHIYVYLYLTLDLFVPKCLIVRSPSSMVISWSYVWFRLLTLVIKRYHTPFFHIASFCCSHFFVWKDNWWNFFSFTFAWLSGPGYPPPVILCFPIWLTSFIKLSADGDLQCEWNSDIFLKYITENKYPNFDWTRSQSSTSLLLLQLLTSCTP